MINIEEPDQVTRITPLFRLAFRPFFLGGALFSMIALLMWGVSWLAAMAWVPYGGWVWWHAHEMIFGFVVAIMSGFLLTAVKNWTGLAGFSGWPLAGLFLLWMLARLLLFYPIAAIEVILPWLDMGFLIAVAAIMGRLVWRARQMQQMIFIVILLLLAVANAQMHWAVASGNSGLAREASHSAIFMLVLVIVILGGRVIPAFTANGTGTARLADRPMIELLSIGTVVLLVLLHITGLKQFLADYVLGGLFLGTALVHLWRFFRWRPWVTAKVPLLWSLHLAYCFIVVGFFLCAYYFLAPFVGGISLHYATILHSFTVGGAGLMILSMMSRVSLGHTGRPLQINRWLAFGFLCIVMAYVCRIWLPLLAPNVSHYWSYLASIVLWLLGYGLFVSCFLPILTRPRIDGRAG